MKDARIYEHPILSFNRKNKVTFTFEGKTIEAYQGESILAALYAIGISAFTKTPFGSMGPFCMIGKCSSCFVKVNNIPYIRSCKEPVREGIKVERQWDLPDIPQVSNHKKTSMRTKDVDLLVVGAGPAGLSASIEAAKRGLKVLLVDEHFKAGGQLVKQTHKFFGSKELMGGLRGFQIAEKLVKEAIENNVEILLQSSVFGYFKEGVYGIATPRGLIKVNAKTAIISTGATERFLIFKGNYLPGVMGAGGAQTLMNEYGVKPGNVAIVVGAGNVGLIIAYQLLQAGVKVKAVLEIMPEIGGWFVHAAKIRRLGVPILVSHTLLEARGLDHVESAIIARVDKNFKPIANSEREIKCDLILLAVGLRPDSRLLAQMGAKMKWIPELGGLVPLHDEYFETTIPGVYVAGDAGGIEEATTAIISGKIAGLSAVIKIIGYQRDLIEERERLIRELYKTRETKFSKRVIAGLSKVIISR